MYVGTYIGARSFRGEYCTAARPRPPPGAPVRGLAGGRSRANGWTGKAGICHIDDMSADVARGKLGDVINNRVAGDRVGTGSPADQARAKVAGSLFAIGALQWVFCVLIAEGLHPGFTLPTDRWIPYSNQMHYVSELGLGSTALIFNLSTMVA